MLDTIRRHQQSWLTYAIFVAIIVVFAINFGPGSSSCRRIEGTSYAAVVDGEYIRQQEYQLALQQQLEAFRRRAQGSFELSDDMVERMGIRQQVIDGLIQARLLAKEAERRGLRVSDAELLEHLERAYRVNEVSAEDYRNFVERSFRTTVQQFEDARREELSAQKIAQLVMDGVSVSDGELRQDFNRERDRAMIEYVRLDLTGVKLDEPAAAAVETLIAAEPKAIEERYQLEAARYRTPEQRRARHILVKLAQDASDADVARARSQLLGFKDQVDAGADFAAIAAAGSHDEATKGKGGDLGMHKRGELAPPLEQAIFSLQAGALTREPVQSDDGLHLVRLEEVKPSLARPLEEVKREVAGGILRERAADAQLARAAGEILAGLAAGKKLEALSVGEDEAQKLREAGRTPAKPVRYESPWIMRSQEAIPRIGIAPEMHKDVFALSRAGEVAPKVYKVGRAYYVAVLKERETPDPAKYEAEKSSLREQALWAKRTRVLQEWLQHLRSQADVELNPALFANRGARQTEG